MYSEHCWESLWAVALQKVNIIGTLSDISKKYDDTNKLQMHI